MPSPRSKASPSRNRLIRTVFLPCLMRSALTPSSAFVPSITTTPLPRLRHSVPGRENPSFPRQGFRRESRKSPSSSSSLSLSLSPAALQETLGSVAVLAGVILIHESGHFLAARGLGMRVKEFSVGVGPKLLGFSKTVTIEGTDNSVEEDTIDFSLRLIPLGGYVQFPENYNRTLAMEVEDDAREERMSYRRERKEKVNVKDDASSDGKGDLFSFWKGKSEPEVTKKTKTSGGRANRKTRSDDGKEATTKSWWNTAFLSSATKVNDKKPQVNDKKRGVGNIKQNRKDDNDGENSISYYDDPNLLQNRPWPQRAVVLVGGIVFNLILSFTLYFGQVTIGNGIPSPVFSDGVVVSAIPSKNAPANGLFQQGDVIVGINGEQIVLSGPNSVSSAQDAVTKFITTTRKTPPGESISVSVLRPTETSSSAVPRIVKVTPRQGYDGSGNLGPPSIGIMLTPNYLRTDMIKAESIPDAASKAGSALVEVTSRCANSITSLISSNVKGESTGQSLSGPIGVIRTGSQIVSSRDADAVIAFAALISVNLAVINSLPFPGLDGGQLVFVAGEAIFGKKIDQKLEERINGYALLLLLFVSLSTTVGDVGELMK